MQILDNYSSIGIGKSCEGDDTVNESPATAKTQFFLIADAYIKKLKLDELRRELKARVFTTDGLKTDLKKRLEKDMVDKVSVLSSISEAAAPPLVFGEGLQWKTLTPLEEPVFDSTVSTEYHAPTVGPEEVSVVKKSNF